MNSVIAYKQFSLGEGLADLFTSEVKNFEAFKASVVDSARKVRSLFGHDKCWDEWKDNTTWKDHTHSC